MTRESERRGKKAREEELHIYSQEFKARNYSDGGAAYYVKIRLGVSESEIGFDGRKESWTIATLISFTSTENCSLQNWEQQQSFWDENEDKRDMKCYEQRALRVCECAIAFWEARTQARAKVNGKAYGRWKFPFYSVRVRRAVVHFPPQLHTSSRQLSIQIHFVQFRVSVWAKPTKISMIYATSWFSIKRKFHLIWQWQEL